MSACVTRRIFLKQADVVGFGAGFFLKTNAADSSSTHLPALSPVDRFNYVVGTQTFDPRYQFTKKPKLVETAEAIREMGASVIKFRLHEDKSQFHSLREAAAGDTAIQQVFAMPFAHYLLWAYPIGGPNGKELYDLCRYLLQTYQGTGKTFYLGHWEGDWELRGKAGGKDDPTRDAIARKIQWLNERQKAVDDARRDTPHEDVNVHCYAEVNLVRDAMAGRPCMTNEVLPHANVDFVSYSSYDTTLGHTPELGRTLDFIESHLSAKPGITGKRVWVGEYGFPADLFSAAQQDTRSREVIKAALQWGCPFVLYWEIYNNEVKDGKQRGFWLIDDKGAKVPAYHSHADLCQWGRKWVAQKIKGTGGVPSDEEYRRAAIEHLDGMK